MDRATFDRLVVDHLQAAQRFAIRLTGDVERAEDLVQDALVRAHRGWQTFRGESKFQTWLFQIVVNCFRDRLSREASLAGTQRVPGTFDEDELSDERANNDPQRQASARELGEIVAAEVSQLPPRQREVLVLTVYENLSAAEVAGVLGMSEQNVRTNLHHARERLRRRLAKHLDADQATRGNR